MSQNSGLVWRNTEFTAVSPLPPHTVLQCELPPLQSAGTPSLGRQEYVRLIDEEYQSEPPTPGVDHPLSNDPAFLPSTPPQPRREAPRPQYQRALTPPRRRNSFVKGQRRAIPLFLQSEPSRSSPAARRAQTPRQLTTRPSLPSVNEAPHLTSDNDLPLPAHETAAAELQCEADHLPTGPLPSPAVPSHDGDKGQGGASAHGKRKIETKHPAGYEFQWPYLGNVAPAQIPSQIRDLLRMTLEDAELFLHGDPKQLTGRKLVGARHYFTLPEIEAKLRSLHGPLDLTLNELRQREATALEVIVSDARLVPEMLSHAQTKITKVLEQCQKETGVYWRDHPEEVREHSERLEAETGELEVGSGRQDLDAPTLLVHEDRRHRVVDQERQARAGPSVGASNRPDARRQDSGSVLQQRGQDVHRDRPSTSTSHSPFARQQQENDASQQEHEVVINDDSASNADSALANRYQYRRLTPGPAIHGLPDISLFSARSLQRDGLDLPREESDLEAPSQSVARPERPSASSLCEQRRPQRPGNVTREDVPRLDRIRPSSHPLVNRQPDVSEYPMTYLHRDDATADEVRTNGAHHDPAFTIDLCCVSVAIHRRDWRGTMRRWRWW